MRSTSGTRLFSKLAFFALLFTASTWPQASKSADAGWQTPVPFEVITAGKRWAITATIKGSYTSDGNTVEIAVDKCELYRPKTFDSPLEVMRITPGIIRNGEPGKRRWVRMGASHDVNKTLNPDETASLEPFRLNIKLLSYPLLKGDTLAFNLFVPSTHQGKASTAMVPVYVPNPFPVTQVAAYCADAITESANQSFRQFIHVCQDSTGRVRNEYWNYLSVDSPKSTATLTSIEILDPVSNSIYHLNPKTKTAQWQKGHEFGGVFEAVLGGIIGGLPESNPSLRPVDSETSLGTRVMNGISADGTLHTTVYPKGHQGQAEQITVSVESWYSFQIQAGIKMVRTDPRSGRFLRELKDIQIGEPDTALFQVPADFQLVNSK